MLQQDERQAQEGERREDADGGGGLAFDVCTALGDVVEEGECLWDVRRK